MAALFAMCWLSQAPHAWADPSFPLLRTSSATEKQLQEETLYLKEESVSIASRYEQPISRAPSDVYVITDEDIRNSGATDIPTLLRRVPGIEVMQTSAADFNVSVRGNNQLRANKLLVMVDGRSIYIEGSGTVQWKLLPVTLIEVKRIEILKGPASAVYGFNAFDGVVNIITKAPEEVNGTTLQVAGGELGTLLTNAVQAGTIGNLGYRVSGVHEQTQQWSDGTTQALNSQRMNIVGEYPLLDKGRIRAEAGVGRSNPHSGPLNETNTSESNNSVAHAFLSFEKNDLLVRGWWNGRSTETTPLIFPLLAPLLTQTDRFGRADQQLSYNTYDFETRYRLKPLEILTVNIGTNYRHITASSNYLGNRTAQNRLGFYIQGDWTILPTLEASAGLRYDLDTFINPTLAPRGALIYRMHPNHTLRFSSSVAYRSPTVNDTNLSILNPLTLPGLPPVTTVVLGSTDVKPEQIISYELGYQGWWWGHRLRTRVNGFFNHISDLIAFRSPSDNPLGTVRPINGGVADIYGGEVGMEFLVTSWLSGFANYAYQEIAQSSTGFSRRGFPHHKVNAGLRAKWNSFSGEVLYHHVGNASYPLADAFTNLAPFFPTGAVLPQEQVPAYNLLNLRLGYLLWQQPTAGYMREAELAVSVFNALNDEHREHPLGDLLGTRVMGWLTVKL
jgi:outer membrane receptor for ferrienterochelin and colicin